MGSSGGGSSSGAISYPTYMTSYHETWLQKMNALIYNVEYYNPYAGSVAVDPSPWLSANDSAIGEILTLGRAFDPDADWLEARDDAVYEINNDATSAWIISNLDALEVMITALEHNDDWAEAAGVVKLAVQDSDYTNVINALEVFRLELAAFVAGTFWGASADTVKAKVDTMLSTTEANADGVAFAATLRDDATLNVIPRFQAGMRDVNAAMSSAFVLGESILWGMMERDAAKYLTGVKEKLVHQRADMYKDGLNQMVKLQDMKFTSSGQLITQKLALFAKKWEITTANVDIVMKALETKIKELKGKTTLDMQYFGTYIDTVDKNVGTIMQAEQAKINLMHTIAHTWIESNRIAIVAAKEWSAEHLARREAEYLWALKTYQYAGNLLASIGAGVAVNEPNKASATQSAIGGGLSGAATGAMIGASQGTAYGGYYGAAIGAVVGAAAGLIGRS